jgi:SAF domain
MEFPSPTPRRISRPSWLDLRLVLGVVLVLAAVLIGAEVVGHARHTTPELAVTRNLAAGTTLQPNDLRTVDARIPDGARLYLSDARRAVGHVLARPLAKGELLPAAVLRHASNRTTVSVPFAADAAPKLSRGERIVVWLSTRLCPSTVLLPDVTVQDVHAADAGTFTSAGSGQDVVVTVAPDLAARVVGALAIPDATIRAGVLAGAAAPGATGAELPALDRCAPASSSP